MRSMVILVGGLTQAIGCGYRLANNLLRSRVGGVREVARLLQVFRLWGARAQSLMEGGKTPRGGVGGYLRTP